MAQNTAANLTPEKRHYPWLIVLAAGIISFGLTVLLMSIAYVQDLQLLREVPEAIWLFVCGVPTDNEMVLPLIIGVGIITVLLGIGMIAFDRIWKRMRRA